jgi:hypothetical protein
MYALSRTAASI